MAVHSVVQFSVAATPVGDPATDKFRVFLERDGKRISFWHDVPLVANGPLGHYNMIVEIPRGKHAKMETSTSEEANPIKQDIKNGKLRNLHNVAGFTGYFASYGALPQTWEDPAHVSPDTGAKGDKDPLDVFDLGADDGQIGQIKQVKVLGVLAMIDEGETDWKVVAIDVKDPLAAKLNDIDDVEREKPGLLAKIHEWYRDYKIPDGKPPNQFGFGGKYQNRAYALKVIQETHGFWAAKYGGAAAAQKH